jgi:hypothetical protein
MLKYMSLKIINVPKVILFAGSLKGYFTTSDTHHLHKNTQKNRKYFITSDTSTAS